MIKSVMCAVDVSNGDIDSTVLEQAARMAEMDGAQLDVITVLPDFGKSLVAGFFEAGFHEKAEAEAARHLRDLCIATLGEERNQSVRHIVATGTAYTEILHAAEIAGSDLIVIGAHKLDIKDYMMGPNASRVARHAQCSVFVVR
ncbi:universal stress protein [Sedimentitalea nanhaiensis]|uniref:Nucleotide-binding universal stress protein, UspA family n=1 Tax=Sedimentitalea nanhaiensis TaxID=999627 RepID=A0A1I7DNF6_9RHOB|nr:universal stress protein [Sedimentitalea nanhaiensis]SFU13219.1 Nucleotide-binding universal stress protein, UspA family [Sedimentitalea nanhaiensis]